MGKSENYLFFRNYCSLKVKTCFFTEKVGPFGTKAHIKKFKGKWEMKIYTNDLVKGHSDFKVKCLTFGLYTQVSDSGPLGPLVI